MAQIAANIDIAPTVLELAGLTAPHGIQGRSLLPLARGEQVAWRDALLYEYYWERNYPQTPTMHALRGDQYKYIRYHGLWDIDELFDLQADPLEQDNLIFSPGHEAIARQLNERLFQLLRDTDGMAVPLQEDAGDRYLLRRADGSAAARFPAQLFKK